MKLNLAEEHRRHMAEVTRDLKAKQLAASANDNSTVPASNPEDPTTLSGSDPQSSDSQKESKAAISHPKTLQWELQKALDAIQRLEAEKSREEAEASNLITSVKEEAVSMVKSAREDTQSHHTQHPHYPQTVTPVSAFRTPRGRRSPSRLPSRRLLRPAPPSRRRLYSER